MKRTYNMTKLFRLYIQILLLAIVIFSTYAFASANTNTARAGGEGASVISGWNVSKIKYQLAADPSLLSAVEFDLDKPAGYVKVSLNSTNTTYYDCDNAFDFHWICYTEPNTWVALADELRIVAVDME